MKSAIELVTEERQRQITEEGYDEKHDEGHDGGALALAAAAYASHPLKIYRQSQYRNSVQFDQIRPFDEYDIDPEKDELRCLVIGAALMLAEIERIMKVKIEEDANR